MKDKTIKEYYDSGELKSEGNLIELQACTSRGSGKSIVEVDDHEFCQECDMYTTKRKIGLWKYYYKNGQLKMEGNYIVLDFIDLPNHRDGIWKTYDKDGKFISELNYKDGERKSPPHYGRT